MKHAFVDSIVRLLGTQLLWRFRARGDCDWSKKVARCDVTGFNQITKRCSILFFFLHSGGQINLCLDNVLLSKPSSHLIPVSHFSRLQVSMLVCCVFFDMRMVQQNTEHGEPEYLFETGKLRRVRQDKCTLSLWVGPRRLKHTHKHTHTNTHTHTQQRNAFLFQHPRVRR